MREGLVALSFDLNEIQHFPPQRPFFPCISYMNAASGLSWSMELLAVATCQYALKIVALSVRFIRI